MVVIADSIEQINLIKERFQECEYLLLNEGIDSEQNSYKLKEAYALIDEYVKSQQELQQQLLQNIDAIQQKVLMDAVILGVDVPVFKEMNLKQQLFELQYQSDSFDELKQQRQRNLNELLSFMDKYCLDIGQTTLDFHNSRNDYLSNDSLKNLEQFLIQIKKERDSRFHSLIKYQESIVHLEKLVGEWIPSDLKCQVLELNLEAELFIDDLPLPWTLQLSFLDHVSCLNQKLHDIHEKMIQRFTDLILHIQTLWKDLEMTPDRELLVDINKFKEYEEVYNRLKDEWKQKMMVSIEALQSQVNELWDKCATSVEHRTFISSQLKDVYTVSSMNILKAELEKWSCWYKETQDILKLIYSRRELLDKMKAFEQTASDPKRLFRPSFQLIEEEKFRKNCVPNLLSLEGKILQAIANYEKKTNQKFELNGTSFVNSMQDEIQSRFVNETIFKMNPNRKREELHSPKPRKQTV